MASSAAGSGNSVLYPNVTRLPGQGGVGGSTETELPKKQPGQVSDFDRVLDSSLDAKTSTAKTADLGRVKEPLKLSAHAMQRLSDRKIKLDAAMMNRVSEGVDRAQAKGLEDTLVLAGDSAFIVSVKNRTIITAMDQASMKGNVFTNIDGAVIV